jgi:CheY-like chemotaxis protein
MATYTLNGKRVLTVDDEPDILDILNEEISETYPECTIDKATSFLEASKLLATRPYDLVILDIMGVNGFDLLKRSASRDIPTVMLTAHSLTPESLKQSFEMGARAYIPKNKLGEIVPFLEEVLQYENLPGWSHLYENLRDYFNAKWGQYWQKVEERFGKNSRRRLTATNNP